MEIKYFSLFVFLYINDINNSLNCVIVLIINMRFVLYNFTKLIINIIVFHEELL